MTNAEKRDLTRRIVASLSRADRIIYQEITYNGGDKYRTATEMIVTDYQCALEDGNKLLAKAIRAKWPELVSEFDKTVDALLDEGLPQ